MQRLEIMRQVDVADLGPLHDLFRAAEAVDHRWPLSDHLWLDLVQGGGHGFAGLLLWGSDRLRPVAYAQLSRAPASWLVELVVDPRYRADPDTATDLAAELLDAARTEAARLGGGTLQWWVVEPSERDDLLAAEQGMEVGRDLLQLRRPLPLPAPLAGPTPLPIRSFRPGEDEAAWLDLNNRAFAGHPEQGGWDLATLVARMEEDWFDPDGFLLHERDGRLAGFCWTKEHRRAAPVLGEIYVIGVDPDFHGLGLGRSLTVAGLDHLARQGVTTAMLHVDAANRPALSLYASLGFERHRLDRAYRIHLEPAHP